MVRYIKTFYSEIGKPLMDASFAMVSLAAAIPFFIAIAVLIKLTSKGGIFFVQTRVGKNEKRFKIVKFRTMKETAAFDVNNPVVADNNKNLTFIGKFLRRTKLDELPQLFNILKMQMSFIGPRPFVEDYMSHYEDWEKVKFDVRPGLTGWSQVHGNGYLDLKHRSCYDIEYVKKMGFLMDIRILFRSVLVVLFGEKKFLKPVSQKQINLYKHWEYRKTSSKLALDTRFDNI